ncbi:MAG: hypothetical protein NXY57DRAFT_868860, partial [Lentinula lateritia]
PDIPVTEDESDEQPIAIRRPVRTRKPPGEWWKTKPSTSRVPANNDDSDDSNDDYYGDAELAASTTIQVEPQNYREAMHSSEAFKWEEAMNNEISAHLANNTWDIVDLPPGVKVM